MKYDWKKVLEGSLNRSRYVERYSSFPHIHRENVAEHSYYVALYGILLWHECDQRCSLMEILWRCIVHDLEESVTGDMIRSVKHHNASVRDAFHDAGASLFKDMLSEIVNPSIKDKEDASAYDLYDKWENAKDDTIEGWVVKLADFLSVVSYVFIEERYGNKESARIRAEIVDNLIWYGGGLQQSLQVMPEYNKKAGRLLLNVVRDVIAIMEG